MAFDPRSLERLKELGRTLPKPLPAVAPPSPEPKRASEQRHRVETETDPEALFRELITISTDGTVPPHLLDRLRQSEQQKLAKPPGPSPLGQSQPRQAPSARTQEQTRARAGGGPRPTRSNPNGDWPGARPCSRPATGNGSSTPTSRIFSTSIPRKTRPLAPNPCPAPIPATDSNPNPRTGAGSRKTAYKTQSGGDQEGLALRCQLPIGLRLASGQQVCCRR
jgi:hypothetical protein